MSRQSHTEVTGTLSTDDALVALERFIIRQEITRLDDGSGVIGANNTLKAEVTKLSFARQTIARGYNLVFNSPSAPHFARNFGNSHQNLQKPTPQNCRDDETLTQNHFSQQRLTKITPNENSETRNLNKDQH